MSALRISRNIAEWKALLATVTHVSVPAWRDSSMKVYQLILGNYVFGGMKDIFMTLYERKICYVNNANALPVNH